LQEDGTYKTYIGTYDLTVQELDNLNNGLDIDAASHLEMIILDDFEFPSDTSNKVLYVDCVTGTQTFWECSNGRAGHQPGNPGPPACVAGSFSYVIQVEWGSCSESVPNTYEPGTGTGNGGGNGDSPPNDYDGSDPDIHGNGSGGVATSPNTGCRGPRCIEIEFEENMELILNEKLDINPYLIIDIDCDQIQHWQNLAQHIPPQSVIDKIENIDQNNATLFGDFDIQYIENAEGAVVNMDYFPVVVDVLPTNPNTGQQFTPDGFLEYIRTNINDFVDTNQTSFEPYDYLDTGYDEYNTWFSSNPLGTILHLDINVVGTPISNDGSIICSEANNNNWIFTTIEAAGDWNHPVSGNREIGYFYDPNDGPNGSYTYYSRGVDRVTEALDIDMATWMQLDSPFQGGDGLWFSFQNGISNFVNDPNNGGLATSLPYITNRPNWENVKDVLLGNAPISDLGCD